MSGERQRRAEEIFAAAADLAAGERTAFVQAACGEDGELRAQVKELLSVAASAGPAFLDPTEIRRLAESGAADQDGVQEVFPLGTQLGDYSVLGVLGSGGMGVVYIARQERPRRTVALKVIRPGMGSRGVSRRFELEAEVLGRLQHPGIAQIFEAGSAKVGEVLWPYIAMELVDGTHLCQHAADQRLSVREKLTLLERVCEALSHAHQHGVIHRDLKPANILVDKTGQPKILDFGVARATDSDLHLTSMGTSAGELVGTLPYMSPEQVMADPAEVDLRSDVYALGALLLELLTGRRPHALARKSVPEAARIIREEEPSGPSDFDPALRGDIDVIVRKAIAKDKKRRYQSAAELGDDLRRYISGEPILARADSAVYVIRKQIQRHKGVSGAVVAAILALAGFAVFASVQSAKEATAKRAANANAERYRAELAVTNIERGRLLSMTGNIASAERLILQEHAAAPSDLSTWALWELYSRMPVVATLGGHEGQVSAVAASSDGASAATASGSEVSIWDARTWTRVHRMDLGSPTKWVKFTPNGAFVVAATESGELGVWRVATGERCARTVVCESIFQLALAPTGAAPWPIAVLGGDGGVRFLEVSVDGSVSRTGEVGKLTRPMAELSPMVLSPNRALLAVGCADGAVQLWRTDTHELAWEVKEHTARVTSLAISPDGSLLISGGADRAALFWDVAGFTASPSTPHFSIWDNGSVRSLKVSADGKSILAAGFWRAEVWDAKQRVVDRSFTICREPTACATWANGGTCILATAGESLARVWEARANGHVRKVFAHESGAWSVAMSPRGDLVASSGGDGGIRLWHWPGMEPAGSLPGGSTRVRALDFSHDGARLVAGDGSPPAGSTLRVFDIKAGACAYSIPAGARECYSASFSPDDRSIAACFRDASVRLFDASSGELRSTLKGTWKGDGALEAVFSADGRKVMGTHGPLMTAWDLAAPESPVDYSLNSSGWSLCWLERPGAMAVGLWLSKIELWDLSSPAPHRVRTLEGHTQVVTSLTLGPRLRDGTRALVSTSGDGLIKLWDTTTGLCLLTLNPELGPSMKVVCTPDQRWLISSHLDGTLAVWDLSHYDGAIQAATHAAEEGLPGSIGR